MPTCVHVRVCVCVPQTQPQVIVRVLPSAYLEHQGSNRYVPRIYLTEGARRPMAEG